MIKQVAHATRMEEMRESYKILFGKSEENRPLRRPRHRWEDNLAQVETSGGLL
jgi:hypothetical protein